MTIPKTNDEVVAELEAKRDKRDAETAKKKQDELVQNLSIRQRLEQKLNTDVVLIKVPSASGDIELRFKKLCPSEHDSIIRSQQGLGAAKNDRRKAEAEAEVLFSILGEKSLDTLDKGFWKSGKGYSADVMTMVLFQLLKASVLPDEEYIKQIKTFL